MVYDVVVIGGGPGGMAAAVSAKQNGVERVLIIERDSRVGGVLNQCIHDGFGVFEFGESLTGPEYALRWKNIIHDAGVEYMLNAMAIEIIKCEDRSQICREPGVRPYGFLITVSSLDKGLITFECRSIIMATGCRERTVGQLRIPGSRPAGVMTAGAAQYMMNIKNYLPGKSAVILGTGDVGLIMARRLTLEGVNVKMIVGEKASGLMRNYVQCVKDFGIDLRFGCTITKIAGNKRVTGVTVNKLDSDGNPEGSGMYIHCDTLIIAAGMIPERELWNDLDTEGIFFCGNVYKSYDTADAVSVSGRNAGKASALWLIGGSSVDDIDVDNLNESRRLTEEDVRLLSVNRIAGVNERVIFCILCPKGCRIFAKNNNDSEIRIGNSLSGNQKTGWDIENINSEKSFRIGDWKLFGFRCSNGKKYALQELTEPVRTVTSTVLCYDGTLLPVKTERAVPKEEVFNVIEACRHVTVGSEHHRVCCGDIIIENVCGTGVNVIASGEQE